MNEYFMAFLKAYVATTIADAGVNVIVLNKAYDKAYEETIGNLKYTSDLLKLSKRALNEPLQMYYLTKAVYILRSLIPIRNLQFTDDLCFDFDDVVEQMKEKMNEVITYVNSLEEIERSDVASFIKEMYEEYPNYLPKKYNGHNLSDETIRISRKEMIDFFKANDIVLKETGKDKKNGYVDYDVYLLQQKR